MRLQLLVPHYHEEPEEVCPLLDSLYMQQGISFEDFGVVIVFDGDEATPLPETLWELKYPFHIKFVHVPHGGLPYARNVALDNATADYVMFCDADDCFSHLCGLNMIFTEMDKGEFDTFTSLFVEETKLPDGNKPTFIHHKNDHTFVHGKVHRRQWLIDNDLRFDETIPVHEDAYFNVLCDEVALPERKRYLPQDFYLWKWRDNSICRRDPDYLLKTFRWVLYGNGQTVDELERRGLVDRAKFHCAFIIVDSYYRLQLPEWAMPENTHYRQTALMCVADYMENHKHLWNTIMMLDIMPITQGCRMRYITQGMPMETQTMAQWLAEVRSILPMTEETSS